MSNREEDRRGDDRMEVKWSGTVIKADDSRFACRIADVSLAGTLVECDAQVSKNEELILSIPDLGDFAGEVQWIRSGCFGLALIAGPDLLLKRIAEEKAPPP